MGLFEQLAQSQMAQQQSPLGAMLAGQGFAQQPIQWRRYDEISTPNKAGIPVVIVSFLDSLREEIDEWLKL